MYKAIIFIIFSFPMCSLEVLPLKNINFEEWRFIKDQVMGGKSDGSLSLIKAKDSFEYLSAKGFVSIDGGGFLMFRKEIDRRDLKKFTKVKFKARGNNEMYYVHIKSRNSIFPWVRYLAKFNVNEEWNDYEINISSFIGHSNKRTFKKSLDPQKIKFIGIEAFGRDQKMQLDIASIELL